jgi:hypothetical protein
MKAFSGVFRFGAAAVALLLAIGVLVLGDRRGAPPASTDAPPFVGEPTSPKTSVAARAPGTVPEPSPREAIARWLAAGGDGDESGLGDPATYDASLVQELVEKYEALPDERRRERGALVYLLARTEPEKEALAFVRRVLREKPCVSLADCRRPPTGHDDHDPSLVTTLAYPQLMALAMAEARAARSAAPAEWRALAEEARSSDVPSIKRRAEAWLAGTP